MGDLEKWSILIRQTFVGWVHYSDHARNLGSGLFTHMDHPALMGCIAVASHCVAPRRAQASL
jgi:hypothetical protein